MQKNCFSSCISVIKFVSKGTGKFYICLGLEAWSSAFITHHIKFGTSHRAILAWGKYVFVVHLCADSKEILDKARVVVALEDSLTI